MSIAKLTHTALNAATAYAGAINDLRKACAKLTYEKARAEILPAVASFYGVAVVDGKGKAAGTQVFDREAKSYEAAKRALTRLLADLYETPKAEPKSMRLSAELRKAAEAYLANFDNVADAIAALRHITKK
jgi:hypothetical protein